jgi:hypothetical protein
MKNWASFVRAAQLVAATVVCLLILAMIVPSLGSVSLSNHKIGYGWCDVLAVVIILAPLALIFIGAAFSKIAENVGWSLFFAILFVCIISMA